MRDDFFIEGANKNMMSRMIEKARTAVQVLLELDYTQT